MIVREAVMENETQLEEGMEQETQQKEAEAQEGGIDLTTEEIVQLAAGVASWIKCRNASPEAREEFERRYVMYTTTVLKLIGFDSALRKLPIKMLSPEYTVALGVAILIGFAIFLPVPNVQVGEKKKMEIPVVTPSPSETKEEVTEEKSEMSKEEQNALEKLRAVVKGGENQ